MAQLEQDFDAYLKTHQESQAYQLEQDFDRYQKDMASGGSIRQAPIERNPPVGAIVGGVAGAAVGAATGNPAAAFGLGALGAAGGEAGQQLLEHAIGSPAAPQTSLDAAGRMLEESGMQTLGEGVGRVLGIPLVGRTVLRASKHVTPEVRQAIQFLEPRTAQGFLPAEVTDTWGTDLLHNIAEHAMIGGAAIKEFKANRTKLFEGIADELVDQLGPRMNADDAGRALMDAVHGNRETARIPTTMLYNAVEHMAGNAPIDLKAIKTSTQHMYEIAKQAGGLEDRNMGTTLLEFLHNKPDAVPYPVAKQIRTEIRTLQTTLESSPETKSSPAIGKAKQLYGQLTDQIRAGLKQQDPFLAQQWDEANLLERGAQMQFNDKLIRSLVKKSDEMGTGAPEKMAQALFKPNNVTTIKRVKNAVADDTQWQKMLSANLQTLMTKGTTRGGELDGQLLEQAMFGRTGLGAETMVAAYGPQRVAQYRELINALKVAQRDQSHGTGSMFIQLRQAGAAVQLAGVSAGIAGLSSDEYREEGLLSGGAFIISPYILSRIMTNPTTARWIIEGARIKAGTPAALGMVGRILAAAIPHAQHADTHPQAMSPPRPTTLPPSMPVQE